MVAKLESYGPQIFELARIDLRDGFADPRFCRFRPSGFKPDRLVGDTVPR